MPRIRKQRFGVGLRDVGASVALKWMGGFLSDGCRLGGRLRAAECRDVMAKPQPLPAGLPKGCLAG